MKQAEHLIICGAQRSATTYLTKLLSFHPNITFAQPMRPEPKFFLDSNKFEKGYSFYLDHFFNMTPETVSSKDNLILSEKSTSYIEYTIAADRIKKTLPHAKLIFVLRDPIERAISNINFSRMHGYEKLPINEAILREINSPKDLLSPADSGTSVSPQAYLQRGCYIDYLEIWYDRFRKDQILLILTENLIQTDEEINRVFEFLGVKNDLSKEDVGIVNSSDKFENNDLTPQTIARLQTYFKTKNEALSKSYNLDLAPWTNFQSC